MGHAHGLSLEEQRKADKKVGFVGFWVLLFITFGEVAIALGLKGVFPPFLLRLAMISLSLVKAYYIVSIFMHLGHEVRAMAMTIVLPLLLLVWAVIAFLMEGESVRDSRNYVNGFDPLEETVEPTNQEIGSIDAKDLPKEVSFK